MIVGLHIILMSHILLWNTCSVKIVSWEAVAFACQGGVGAVCVAI
jgi:hypothetical protein